MSERIGLVLLDVNETLSDLSPLDDRFAAVGAGPPLRRLWFAQVLRDGFALAAAGASASFGAIAEQVAGQVLATAQANRQLGGRELDEAVSSIVDGLAALPVHPDVPDGIRRLRAAGLAVGTLTNGPAERARQLLERAGVGEEVTAYLSVEDAGLWKPAERAYAYAVEQLGVAREEAVLAAVHPWDIDGASRAGLRTAWVDRDRGAYPAYFRRPDVVVHDLRDLAAELVS